MTREEAIKHGEEQLEIFGGTHREFIEMSIKALKQLPKLQNRCFALTQGQLCMFCPYDCENRTTEHRSEEQTGENT